MHEMQPNMLSRDSPGAAIHLATGGTPVLPGPHTESRLPGSVNSNTGPPLPESEIGFDRIHRTTRIDRIGSYHGATENTGHGSMRGTWRWSYGSE